MEVDGCIDATVSARTRINIPEVMRRVSLHARMKLSDPDIPALEVKKQLITQFKDELDEDKISEIYHTVHAQMTVADIEEKHKRIDTLLSSKSPIELIETAYRDIHCGDLEIAKAIVLAYCCTRELTNGGLQPKAAGSPGSGKTVAFEAGVYLLPQEDVYIGTLSDKALQYDKLPSGCVFLIDDAELSEGLNTTIKTAMSRFQERVIHRSVKRDLSGVNKLEMPERCIFLFTSVDDVKGSDEQLVDRLLPCNISRSPNDKTAIARFHAFKDAIGEPKLIETDNVRAIRDHLSEVGQWKYRVIVPFAHPDTGNIVWDTNDLRLQREFMTILKAHCVLNFKDREQTREGPDNDPVIILTATKEDFDFVYQLSHFKNRDIAEGRYTPSELKVIMMIHESEKLEQDGSFYVSRKELTRLGEKPGYGLSSVEITYAMNGRNEKKDGGLLMKLPGLERVDVNELTSICVGDVNKEWRKGILYRLPENLPDPRKLDKNFGIAHWSINKV